MLVMVCLLGIRQQAEVLYAVLVTLAHGLARRARDISWSRSWSAIAHRQGDVHF